MVLKNTGETPVDLDWMQFHHHFEPGEVREVPTYAGNALLRRFSQLRIVNTDASVEQSEKPEAVAADISAMRARRKRG